jgi:hypothetical protein
MSSAASKISGLGFTFPYEPDEIHASTSIPKWRTNASRSRLVLETSPSLIPAARRRPSTGSASS